MVPTMAVTHPVPVEHPLASAKRARRVTPPTGWQFSRPAIVAREITARLIGPFIGWFLVGPRVVGAEHLAALEGPSLICPSHASHFDFSALRLALGPAHRRRLTAAAAADYFATKRSRWLIAAWLGAFAFNRTGRGADSIAAAEGLLAAGWHVVLFPEGTRTMTGDINPFQPGIGLLARHTGRQVLPVAGRGPLRRADPSPHRRGRPGVHRPPGGARPGPVTDHGRHLPSQG
jgi:1-acyl-sn-glycerol-3-phosphate acyltransferase